MRNVPRRTPRSLALATALVLVLSTLALAPPASASPDAEPGVASVAPGARKPASGLVRSRGPAIQGHRALERGRPPVVATMDPNGTPSPEGGGTIDPDGQPLPAGGGELDPNG